MTSMSGRFIMKINVVWVSRVPELNANTWNQQALCVADADANAVLARSALAAVQRALLIGPHICGFSSIVCITQFCAY